MYVCMYLPTLEQVLVSGKFVCVSHCLQWALCCFPAIAATPTTAKWVLFGIVERKNQIYRSTWWMDVCHWTRGGIHKTNNGITGGQHTTGPQVLAKVGQRKKGRNAQKAAACEINWSPSSTQHKEEAQDEADKPKATKYPFQRMTVSLWRWNMTNLHNK